jgi:hypothetical protein
MHASVCSSKSRSVARHLLVVVAVVLGLGLASSGTASAQTGFQASITGIFPKPKPCPDSYLCGTATTNFGPAAWTWVIISDEQISNTCGVYKTAVTFVLGDGSTLVLDENGTLCQPGNALSAPGSLVSNGNPFTISGDWTVQSADGHFGSLSGAGTDTLHLAGAQVHGTYTATS